MNLTSVFVSGVSGSTLGAKVDTAIGAWFGGVLAVLDMLFVKLILFLA